jgi:transcriptional regulator with XRE-family HTH domain
MSGHPADGAAALGIDALPSSDDLAETTANTLVAMGGRIRELRQARGLTLQALAEVSGLSTSMLSLVERGRASPSIGSLIVIASALGVAMSDLIVDGAAPEENIVVRASQARIVETAEQVVRRLLREDRGRGVSVAINEYAPHTGSTEHPISHDGFEYGFVLEGCLTVEVDGTAHVLQPGDLIAYRSRRRHKIWNHAETKARTLWFNLDRE